MFTYDMTLTSTHYDLTSYLQPNNGLITDYHDGKAIIYTTELTPERAELCILTNRNGEPDLLELMCNVCETETMPDWPVPDIFEGGFPKEITPGKAMTLINKGNEDGLIIDAPDTIVNCLHLTYLVCASPFFSTDQVEEKIYIRQTKSWCDKKMQDMSADRSLQEEADRIFAPGNPKQYAGIPVQYALYIKNKSCLSDTLEVLMSSLLSNNRLLGGRVAILTSALVSTMNGKVLDDLFEAYYGQTLVFDLREPEPTPNTFGGMQYYSMKALADAIEKYGNQVQCILVLDEKDSVPEYGKELMGKMSAVFPVVEISEGSAYEGTRLRKKQEQGRQIRNGFSVYAGIENNKCEENTGADPYMTLQHMHGLSRVKKMIDDILAYARNRQKRQANGLKNDGMSLHMCFTGAPGTAKTTVARLLAGILSQEGVLRTGKFVEVGRKDLIGEYVGWTAPKVKAAFDSAAGGCLFIDEAYSLVDGYSSGFADEAISCIVQEMENRRSDVMVIFAGYEQPMQDFLEKNEGLKSRISFYVPFDNYKPEELYQIMEIQAHDKGYILADDVKEAVMPIFTNACTRPDFGNGRFARTLVEHAALKQAVRLEEEERQIYEVEYAVNVLEKDPEDYNYDALKILTEDDYRELKGCDFEDIESPYHDDREKAVIGF